MMATVKVIETAGIPFIVEVLSSLTTKRTIEIATVWYARTGKGIVPKKIIIDKTMERQTRRALDFKIDLSRSWLSFVIERAWWCS